MRVHIDFETVSSDNIGYGDADISVINCAFSGDGDRDLGVLESIVFRSMNCHQCVGLINIIVPSACFSRNFIEEIAF